MSDISRRAALTTLSSLALCAKETAGAEVMTAGAVVQPPDARQFRSWDGGTGPSSRYWSKHLKLPWKNQGTGDWTDAAGAEQGSVPFTSTPVTAEGAWYEFDAQTLVERWRRSGENKGFLLRASGSGSASVLWGGRSTATPPSLVVMLRSGAEVHCPCTALASYSSTTIYARDTRQAARTSITSSAILQFDLSRVAGEVASAKVRLYCLSKSSPRANLDSYECDAPRFQLATPQTQPQWGLAAAVGENALKTHPSVIRAGDFSDLREGMNEGGLFDSLSLSEHSVNQQLPDPDAPGTVMFRSSFSPLTRGSFSGKVNVMRADYADPLRPVDNIENQMYCRLYVFLEEDWRSTRDANKMAIGWDLRLGWWNNAQGGYWQATTGNGGARGSGLKLFAPAKTIGNRYDCWEYQGHAIRMEAGTGTDDGNPYEDLRPIESYVYHLDQPSGYGSVIRLGGGVLQRGRWHCLEQHVRMNSVTGPYDDIGNGQAIADGRLRSWVDGVLVSDVRNLRWRRHPELGVQGVWINWYYGGKQPTEREMHYRMNHLVVARRYIGPRLA